MENKIEVIRTKKDIPTIIKYDGRNYILQHQSPGQKKKTVSKEAK